MQFVQSQSGVPQLYAAVESGTALPSGTNASAVWFLLPRAAQGPATITLADSWSAYPAGVYLFVDGPVQPAAQAGFAAAVWDATGDPSVKAVRFAWFSAPNQPAGAVAGPMISIAAGMAAGTLVTSRAVSVDYQNISLIIGMNCPVQLNVDTASVTITQADSANRSIYLTAGWGATRLNVVGSSVTLPLTGNLVGCLQFPMTLASTNGVPDLTSLDVGLRSFYPTPAEADGSGAAADGGFWLSSLRYPVFDESKPLTLYGNLDPFSTDQSRSYFAFNAADAGLPPSPLQTAGSYYSSILGHQLSLRPQPAATAPSAFARLALAYNPVALPPSPAMAYALVPVGDFALQPPATLPPAPSGTCPPISNPALRLMAGLSGVEYIGMATAGTTMLSFFAGRPAYFAGFNPDAAGSGMAEGGEPDAPATRDDTPSWAPTTAWACLTTGAAQGLTYYAQPDASVLYQSEAATPPPAAGGAPPIQPLVYLEAPANVLPATPSGANSFPLLPYAGVTGADLEPFDRLESEVIGPLRRATIASINAGGTPHPPVAGAASVWGVTSQGLLAQFTCDMSLMERLVLAQTPGGGQFALSNIPNPSPPWSALQSNLLFLVISNPAAIAAYLQSADSTITMAGTDSGASWNFLLDPATAAHWTETGLPGAQGTVLILKYYAKPLVDLAKDTTTWARATDFNADPAATSAVMQRIFKAALASTDSVYDTFKSVITDANWRGVLILNGYAPLGGLPEQLQGIAAGVDPAAFFAHHVGINASAVNQATNPISLQNSSMFGLIAYQAPTPLTNTGAGYEFQVQSLTVLFANSAVASFQSQILLMVNQLFGEATIATKPPDPGATNVIALNGVLQTQVLPDGTEHDSYLFQTPTGVTTVIDIDSGVLNAVAVSKAQFITLAAAGGGATLTSTRFVFWGLLDFKALSGFDLFSFGREQPSDPATGLSFANLALDMTFDPNTPNSNSFTFDAGQLSYDLAGSTARAHSLFSHFPLTLTGFTQAKQGATPPGDGYMGVQSPLNQASTKFPWYSLNFDLNLGTVGALAGQAGFTAGLIAAWSPSTSGYLVYTGLKLPGSSGGKREISIEGVLKLTFKTIEMIVQQNSDGTTSYIFMLYNIALSFLSKSFPTAGQVNLVLFGDPTPGATTASLGWYLAYAKASAQAQQQPKPPAAIAAGAPAAVLASVPSAAGDSAPP